ncbi:dickkopf-related protein 3 [Arapaima gigas]
MDNESAKSMLYPHELPPPAQDRSPEQKAANESGHRAEMISEVNNSTVATHFSKTLVQPDGRGNEIDRVSARQPHRALESLDKFC